MDKHARDSYLTLRVAVVIPLLQAVITGLLVGSVAGVVLYLVEPLHQAIALLVFTAVASVAWLFAWRWWRSMLESIDSKIEKIPLQSYLEPEQIPSSVRVEMIESGGRAGEFIDLPISPGKLRQLATGLMNGKSFTEAAWCGSGGIFTRAEFAKLRDEMLRRKLIMLNSPSTPARGYSLTAGGKACIRYLASTTPLLESSSSIGDF